MGIISGHYDQDGFDGGNWVWWTKSKKDPRFNMSGYSVGKWAALEDTSKAVRDKERELRCSAPGDLEYGGNNTR